jgi:hypothetical protein
MFEDNDGFPFVVGGSMSSVTHLHPSAIQIFQLWQVYISSVNPLLKLSHVPTIQAQIISASADTAKIPKGLEVLMFAIYFIAITAMPEQEVRGMFIEDKTVLLHKYHGATQQALVNAGFMRSTDLMVLEAFVLYLVRWPVAILEWTECLSNRCPHQLGVRQYVDPRALFCLIGISVRIATRFGLHKDGAAVGLPPFETEQRRRLWWQIVIFDKRIAEITGSAINALSSSNGDCRFPLNVNDTDLNQHAKDAPSPYPGPTEMLFVLTRCELTVAASPTGMRPVLASTPGSNNGGTKSAAGSLNKPRVQYSPSPSSPDVITHVANNFLPQDLDSYCASIENTYLKHCDPKIPLHYFTLMMTRQALSKLRVIEFLAGGASSDMLDQSERDALFLEGVRMLELDNSIQNAPELQSFRWYTHLQFPFPAYILLLSELKNRTTGDLCERAWDVIIENHERRGMLRNLRSPMHISVGGLLVKAWDGREAAEAQRGRTLATPKIVGILRQNWSKIRKPPAETAAYQAANAALGRSSGGSVAPGSSATTTPTPASIPTSEPSIGATPGSSYPSKSAPDVAPQAMAVGGGGGPGAMLLNDAGVFGPFEGSNPSFGGAGIPDIDFGQVDWNYILQYGAGYNGFTGSNVYQQQSGHQGHHGHHHWWGDRGTIVTVHVYEGNEDTNLEFLQGTSLEFCNVWIYLERSWIWGVRNNLSLPSRCCPKTHWESAATAALSLSGESLDFEITIQLSEEHQYLVDTNPTR